VNHPPCVKMKQHIVNILQRSLGIPSSGVWLRSLVHIETQSEIWLRMKLTRLHQHFLDSRHLYLALMRDLTVVEYFIPTLHKDMIV
jgi:hypothetical protein